MRVPILSACCALLTLAALPAAAHSWSSSDQVDTRMVEHNCPIAPAVRPVIHHYSGVAVHHHARASGGCPVAQAEPGHYAYQRVFTRDEHDWSREDQGSWRRDRRDWADGNWSGRMAQNVGPGGGPGCQDANGPDAYRDRDGGHRAAPDSGMRCHDGGMRREQGYAQGGGHFGYTREMDSGWSSSERGAGWASSERSSGWGGEQRGSSDHVSMTDRYGFLTWPGKTHFLRGQPVGPMGVAPDIGPQAPPEESWQVHP
jgi:hypothetical protein